VEAASRPNAFVYSLSLAATSSGAVVGGQEKTPLSACLDDRSGALSHRRLLMDKLTQSLAARLNELARNLWWTWQPEVIAILRDLDPGLWREANHNPVTFLATLPANQLARRAEETALESRINQAFRRLDEYLRDRTTWGSATCGVLRTRPVAYFSAEFALHESLPIYSGGLGALAGDHLKGASDLGVPLVAVGIFYGQGYFRQQLDGSGWQRERYGHVDLEQLPLRRAVASDGVPLGASGLVPGHAGLDTLPFRRAAASGAPLIVEIPLDGGQLNIGAWLADVGRTTLVLLDSDVEGNPPAHRALTAQLYGGDEHVRLLQEIILGVGGVRMLETLGIAPGVLHLNEGHSAFAVLEVARALATAQGIDFWLAHGEVALRTVFTTHTPLPAGHDRFPPEMVLEHFDWLQREVGISAHDLLGLGRVNPGDPYERFCMTVLGLKSAQFSNGVSALHGHVTRRMWQSLWPGRSEAEVPIGHITNGVHSPSWIAPVMTSLYERYLGRDWQTRISSSEVWRGVANIDDAALWEAHQVQKRRLLNYVARRCQEQAAECSELGLHVPVLDGDVLLLCFARRFAEYKRASLLFADTDRLASLVNAPGRSLQIIMAGKAHPRDENGKRLLQRVVELTRDPLFRDRLVFVIDYDFNVTRHLVQGTDVWLNTPRRPLEACGTSGQKVLLNGGLNLSVLDGWWVEAYDGENGFAIGNGYTHRDPERQDENDAASLYDVLENEVIPLYYDRGSDNVPHGWVARMKHAIATLAWRFNADRMVRDYVRTCYLPAVGAVSSAMPATPRD
jgi:starch phosphorylase